MAGASKAIDRIEKGMRPRNQLCACIGSHALLDVNRAGDGVLGKRRMIGS